MAKQIDATFIKKLALGEVINFSSYINGVSIDSRKINLCMLFVALKGENTNGHFYIKDALEKGAALCIVSQEWAKSNDINSLPLWIVDSPEKTLQKLASEWRNQFDIPLLAITGTNGKTTIRSMICEILKSKFNIISTIGNFNNQLGVPLTLLNIRENHNFCILELGTNHFGEIEFLCNIAKPNVGLITNIGRGHLEFFGDLNGVAKAKEELFLSLPDSGISFINTDDSYIKKMKATKNHVKYSLNSKEADVNGKILSYTNGCPLLEIDGKLQIQLRIPGKITAFNALAAATVGLYYRVPQSEIKDALESFKPVNGRFVIKTSGKVKIIDDTYNANPDSTIAALTTLSLMNANGRKIFVFGDMLELGEKSEKAHAKIGEKAFELGIDSLYTIGKFSKATTDAAKSKGLKNVFHYYETDKLIQKLKNDLRENDIVLIKGSRGSRMEKVTEELTK
jgi:UDP-N-acetylmuramoyl-tripeptide--D-alanyl-D-alanine ligase